ncbi:MAG: class II fructose-bisphosphate aldolase [Candidatus Paceibacterota bacterium]
MRTLRQVIAEARQSGIAIGQFNISTIEAFWAVVQASEVTGQPVIIGLSAGERKFFGTKQARVLIDSVRTEKGIEIFLNADHVHNLEEAREVIEAGYDSMTFDGSAMSMEENIKLTRECGILIKELKSPIIFEGEIGFIGTSSGLLAEMPVGAAIGSNLTTAEEAGHFVRETGVELLAPAIGNIHGLVASGEPRLDVGRTGEICATGGVPLVLHGGSGIVLEDLKAVIKAGVAVVHINTEIRLAWKNGLVKSLAEKPNEISPYKLLAESVMEMQKIVEEKIKIFG